MERVRFNDKENTDDHEDEEKIGGKSKSEDDQDNSNNNNDSSSEGSGSSDGSGSDDDGGSEGDNNDDSENFDDEADDDNPFADPPTADPTAASTSQSGGGVNASAAAPKRVRRFNPWAKLRSARRRGKNTKNNGDDQVDRFEDEHRPPPRVSNAALLQAQNDIKCRLYCCSFVLCALLIFTVFSLVVLLGGDDGGNKDDDTPSPSPTSSNRTLAPTNSPWVPAQAAPPLVTNYALYQVIASSMVDGGASISVDGSPQQKAFLWIQDEDSLTNPPKARGRRSRQLNSLNQEPISKERQIQRFRLVTFYEATNGDYWAVQTKWKSGEDSECTWHGITCRASSQTVVSLTLSKNRISGGLVPELGQLSVLGTLVIDNSGTKYNLTGDLNLLQPLALLDKIQITGNDFSVSRKGRQGPQRVPANFSNLFAQWKEVSHIDLSDNQLRAPVPSSLRQLKTVTWLDLSHNELSGPLLSDDISHMKDLRALNLAHNHLRQSLPEALFTTSLSKLRILNVSHNDFTGNLPNMSGAISTGSSSSVGSMDFEVLDFSHNQFSGNISLNMFTVLGKLQVLGINNNNLSGVVPSMERLVSLRALDFSNNPLLKGRIPQVPVCQRIESASTANDVGDNIGSSGYHGGIVDCPGHTAACNENVTVCCRCCTKRDALFPVNRQILCKNCMEKGLHRHGYRNSVEEFGHKIFGW